MTMIKLTRRVFEKIFGLSWVCFGGGGGGTICFVPQMGHMRTPSRSSVPHVGQITVSSPNCSIHLYYKDMAFLSRHRLSRQWNAPAARCPSFPLYAVVIIFVYLV